MYKERFKTIKFINFVNFKVQKSSQFIIALALIFPVTVLIQHITINFTVWYPLPMLAKPFRYDVSKGCHTATVPWVPWEMQYELSYPIPSHGIPMVIPFPWTSLLFHRTITVSV